MDRNVQNKKFVISLQYLKKEVNVEANFLHPRKHESFLHIDRMIFDRGRKAFPNLPKQQVCNSLQYLKK